MSKVSDLNKFEVFKTNIDLNNLTLKNLLKYFCIRCSKNTNETQLFVWLRNEDFVSSNYTMRFDLDTKGIQFFEHFLQRLKSTRFCIANTNYFYVKGP